MTFDDEELEAVKLESKKTLELTQFVDADEIDPLYYERPYYVVPADDLAEEAFIVLREALRSSGKVALGQLAMRGREYMVSLKPCGRGILLETMRYADEVTKAQGYFRDIGDAKPDAELLELAEALIDRKTAKFDPEQVPRPLCRCAEGADREEAQDRQADRGRGGRAGAARLQRHRPDGGAEAVDGEAGRESERREEAGGEARRRRRRPRRRRRAARRSASGEPLS